MHIAKAMGTRLPSYLLIKWGIKRSPGISKKAGNVILLKTPKTAMMPSKVEAKREEDCCKII